MRTDVPGSRQKPKLALTGRGRQPEREKRDTIMRPLVIATAILALGACTTAPDPDAGLSGAAAYAPTREMTDAEFVDWLTAALPEVCAAPIDDWAGRRTAGADWGLAPLPEDEDEDFLLFQGATRLRVTLPSGDTQACRLRLLAPTARLVAVDGGLKSWAAEQPMTWNIRDIPYAVTPGTMNGRVRGMRERDEAVLRWAYQPSADDAEVTEMQIEWTAAPPAD